MSHKIQNEQTHRLAGVNLATMTVFHTTVKRELWELSRVFVELKVSRCNRV